MFYGPGGDGDDEEIEREAPALPPWIGPPEDELGAVVPLALVVGRSEKGVVALRHAAVYSTGVTFSFVALARGIDPRQSSRLIREQHAFDAEEPSEYFLRIGLELPDGNRVSNLGVRRGPPGGWASLDEAPSGPVFFEHGGGGSSGGGGRVSTSPSFWLWPLPESGTIRVFCEGPSPRFRWRASSWTSPRSRPRRSGSSRSGPVLDPAFRRA